ncbi:unnamed protein product [Plutella xylostella]|uniref:(diamondback moth) hypothetical protein n=1 Tax=Plutella xylostella TaxID=51655 RepID=A0A8S4EBN2_PLUXY|nr:unnamed protein product [Plutella xylostella]
MFNKSVSKMRVLLLTLAAVSVAQARPGIFAPLHFSAPAVAAPVHPLGVEYVDASPPVVRPHPAVELNAESEALLPRELIKSRDFYDNPAIAAGLAKESWFTNKEMRVVEREAEKIPRERIYHIVKSAGFLDRH